MVKISANPRAQSVSAASGSSMSSMFSQIVSKGSKYMEGVKNLVVGTKVRGKLCKVYESDCSVM